MKLGLVLLAVVLLLLVLRVFRTLFGRQRLHARRLVVRAVIATCVAALLCVLIRPTLPLSAGVVVGLTSGATLAWLAYRLTSFHVAADGAYYRPNSYVSAAVAAIFLVRVALRASAVLPLATTVAAQGSAPAAGTAAASPSLFGAVPLTVCAIFVVNGFFIVYSAALARRARRVQAASRAS